MIIKFLKAEKGDSFLLSFMDPQEKPRNIIIDSGLKEAYFDAGTLDYGELHREIEEIKKKGEFIDLMILTHIDNDHICGFLKYFELDDQVDKPKSLTPSCQLKY